METAFHTLLESVGNLGLNEGDFLTMNNMLKRAYEDTKKKAIKITPTDPEVSAQFTPIPFHKIKFYDCIGDYVFELIAESTNSVESQNYPTRSQSKIEYKLIIEENSANTNFVTMIRTFQLPWYHDNDDLYSKIVKLVNLHEPKKIELICGSLQSSKIIYKYGDMIYHLSELFNGRQDAENREYRENGHLAEDIEEHPTDYLRVVPEFIKTIILKNLRLGVHNFINNPNAED